MPGSGVPRRPCTGRAAALEVRAGRDERHDGDPHAQVLAVEGGEEPGLVRVREEDAALTKAGRLNTRRGGYVSETL